jgi:hypothetical protein
MSDANAHIPMDVSASQEDSQSESNDHPTSMSKDDSQLVDQETTGNVKSVVDPLDPPPLNVSVNLGKQKKEKIPRTAEEMAIRREAQKMRRQRRKEERRQQKNQVESAGNESSLGESSSTVTDPSALNANVVLPASTPKGVKTPGGPSKAMQRILNAKASGSGGIKRGRPQDETPPTEQSSNKRRDAKETPETMTASSYAKTVAKSFLTMAVVHVPEPGTKDDLSMEQFHTIVTSLNDLMFEDVESGKIRENLPGFKTYHASGVVKIFCDDASARSWLESVAHRLCSLMDIPLIICQYDKVPRTPRFSAHFPNTSQDTDKIVRLLKLASPQLSNVSFKPIRRTQNNSGVSILFAVRPSDKAILLENGPKFRFGMRPAYIREFVPRQKKTPIPNKDPVSEGITSEFEEEIRNLTIGDAKENDPEILSDEEDLDATVVDCHASAKNPPETSEIAEGPGQESESKTETSVTDSSRKGPPDPPPGNEDCKKGCM